MNKPETQLNRLLKLKIEIQDLEEENNRDKEVWKALGHIVKSRGQHIGAKRRALFEMI